ncbi:zinc finger MYM-type protein 5-like [Limulus polyphemus]|uniref:Zinc finger MYM-type protein 5-like n=1 Tax=Limulus polyphemus TaxID=6850 RepID=A0ABM1B153_LIMPO|nr:zinc finger MYM-type protein 5-like [Limulus polyphemus]
MKLPVAEVYKVDSYFTPATDKDPQTQGDQQSPKQPQPSASAIETTESGISAEKNTGSDANVSVAEPTSTVETTKFTKLNDVGKWDILIEDELSYWILKGPSECQHWNGPFENSKRPLKNQDRYCLKGLFQSRKVNGEIYDREWLVYSPTTGCVYCFVCKLFSTSTAALASGGFPDWQNPIAIQSHENSEEHRTALLTYLTRKRG